MTENPGGAPTTTEPGAIVFLPLPDEGFTVDEIYSLFSSGVITASGEVFHMPGQHNQQTHGHSGAVRPALQQSATIEQIELTTRQELRAITGHTVSVKFTGLEPELAREYAEGVLRGAEHFPHAGLYSIETADTASYLPFRVYAHAEMSIGKIIFDNTYTAAQIRSEIDAANSTAAKSTAVSSKRFFSEASHAGTGTHEYMHIVHGPHSGQGTNNRAVAHAAIKKYAADHGLSFRGAQWTISGYAEESILETIAEAGTDYIYNGGGTELSRIITEGLPGKVTP